MIDLTAFTQNNSAITAEGVMARPLKGIEPLKGVLNNRGRFAVQIQEVAPVNHRYVSPNNSQARLYLTKAFAAPGVLFQATWRSTSSFCLTGFQWGNSLWAREGPEE